MDSDVPLTVSSSLPSVDTYPDISLEIPSAPVSSSAPPSPPHYPIARPYYHLHTDRALPTSYTPLQLASYYNFPASSGSGQKIGIIELGGGYVLSDITTYLSSLGIVNGPTINSISVDGGINDITDTSGANYEVYLDIEIIAALVPSATINVYFAPNSFTSFYNAIQKAITDGCNAISISWGAPEIYWPSSYLTSYNALFKTAADNGINVFCASGDNGSSDGTDGLVTDFPASSQYVIGCGGTTILANEVGWTGSGGGVSNAFSKPGYQSGLSIVKRGVPDICANADPNTGYRIYMQGSNYVIGGTSAVSPLLSGLIGRMAQIVGGSGIGFILPSLYSNPSVFKDITSGSNGAYSCSLGWDKVTGLGAPNGMNMLGLFNGGPVAAFTASPLTGIYPLTVNFTDQTSGGPTSWLWNFGDTGTSTVQSPSHVYTGPGVYSVSLKATNGSGSNTLTKTNYITVTNNITVKAAFTASPLTGTAPLKVVFNNTSVNATSYVWSFGDFTSSTLVNPVHIYRRRGQYTVSLTAINGGVNNRITKLVYINVR